MTPDYDPDREASSLSPVAALVRRHDPDRFLTALFAPPDKRETLLTLYAFNHELARAREVASQPMLALMRLQFWREVVEGAQRSHQIAAPLRVAIDRGELDRDELLGIIQSREVEADASIPTLEEWHAYLLGTAGGLMVTAGRLLGARQPEVLRPLGAAYGAAGVLRSVSALARQGRCLLPANVLAEHDLSPEAVIAAPASAAAGAAVRQLAKVSFNRVASGAAVKLPRHVIAAALPVVLARRNLRRVPLVAPRGIGDRLAVLRAWLTGRP